MTMPSELPWIWLAIGLYAASAACAMATGPLAMAGAGTRQRADVATFGLLGAGLAALAWALATRWVRIGHGPFISLYEVLASSLWSLGLAYAIAGGCAPIVRRTAPVVLPMLLVLAGWLAVANPADTHLPPTYETAVLWLHVLSGKVFLGCALVATGVAGFMLLRAGPCARRFAGAPSDRVLDALAWRLMQAALVFESLMLVAGAVWAQDAWGRYWAWDPLESWAFATWLALAASLHARATLQPSPRVYGLWLAAVFVIAFLTFFGVPFISTAPHKGAV
jgi:ABC-type transport system involved in cytochrome c biogenesis permease subunit